ncbi:Predicted arabinose efflux permease, MFS family [Andreprevotia lacus DSM 23236]|jgi:predicted MFS family arabinose efflux permease|uniref:Predicted arabinose efflux permease, MFS family n=1 Tax=Andreprevotia lacus DSM 23236 TaxID=1121001 RepID=A0A1W1XH93_9NEIS|nr:MFS transporter [Andreprevotia lacus]SMC22878.1 Predicted arabinose efflux permease, MFS family [Andreprevotia lacus DSM 23236]
MKSLQLKLIALSVALLVAAAAVVSLFALRDFEAGLTPQMAAGDREIGASVLRVLDKALDYGVPFAELQGVDDFLDDVRTDNPKVSYLIITNTWGQALYNSRAKTLSNQGELEDRLAHWTQGLTSEQVGAYLNTAIPIRAHGEQIGWLHLGQKADVAQQQLNDVMLDLGTVLVVAGLVALELLRLLLTLTVGTPVTLLHDFLAKVREGDFTWQLPRDYLGGVGKLNRHLNHVVKIINHRYHQLRSTARNQGKIAPTYGLRFLTNKDDKHILFVSALDYIRWPFFLLVFSDSLSLSFFPVFAGQFYDPALGLSRQLASSLPISVFMLVWALAMPWAGQWCDRVGYRRAFGVGAAITTVGLLLTAASQTFFDLLLWRSITAIGYGTVFVTAQSYIANNTPADQRTRGMALFLSTFFAGSLAGAAIGGILVDRLGDRPTFMLSALLSAAAAIFVARVIRRKSGGGAPRKALKLADFGTLLRHKQFAAITFLTAIPSKIALTGFLYYSVPLYLKSVGASQSGTGRMMMAYGLAIIILSPQIARLADALGHRRWFVIAGGYAAALGMFATYLNDSPLGVLISITCLGMAHAVGVSPQLALVGDYCKDAVQEMGQATTTGIFRLMERLGNVLGPLIAGALIASYGFKGAFYGVGILTLITTTLFMLLFFRFDAQKPGAVPA